MVHHSGLRPMTLADTPVVAAMDKLVSVGPWTETLFADCIRVGYECWVLIDGHTIIGYGVLSYGANEAHILNLVIDPAQQRNGLGQKMLQHLLGVGKAHGALEAFLEVRESNVAARALYEKFKFVEIGIRKGYYPAEGTNPREDAITLALPLI